MVEKFTPSDGGPSGWSAQHSGGHRFRWDVEFRGTKRPAFLTYGLLAPKDRFRRILAFEVSRSEYIRDWLDHDTYSAVRELELLLVRKREAGLGRTGAAKAVALELYHQAITPPAVDVAVHKFGAVPVYVVPGVTVSLDIFGALRECQIGVFVSGGDPDERQEDAEKRQGPVNTVELIRSLRIRPDLTFLRYLEDAGEYAHDLRTLGNWSSLFRYGRKIEDVLAKSVRSKLDAVLDYANHRITSRSGNVHLTARDEAREMLAAHRCLLWKVSKARILYLFILNHLYRAVGMKDKCDQYETEYQDNWTLFFSSIEERDRCSEEDPELEVLQAIWGAWHSTDGIRDLLNIEADFPNAAHWLKRLAAFAGFASHVNRLGVDALTTRIFFASRHIEDMREFRRDASALVDEQFPDTAQLLYVDSERAGYPFAEELAPRIWICDALLAVFSPRPEADEEKDWVSYEVVRARRFGVPCLIAREASVTLAEVRRRLERENIRPSDQPVGREHIPELPASRSERAQFLEKQLHSVADAAAQRKCETLLVNFLRNFFTSSQIRIIAEVHRIQLTADVAIEDVAAGRELIPISDLAHLLFMNETKLIRELCHLASSERALWAHGVDILPVVLDENESRCGGNLLTAMEVLRPDLIGHPDADRELRDHLQQIMRLLL